MLSSELAVQRRECKNVVTLNGFDIEENPQGGLQLTSVPVSKKTTFGVRLFLAAFAQQHAC